MNDAFDQLTSIQSWPDVALTLGGVIIVGYCFRFWKKFPNEGIPAVVILTGAIFMMLLAPEHPKDVPARIWHTKNCLVGVIIGFIGWMGHNLIVSRIENWLATKFKTVDVLLSKTSSTGKTQFLTKPPQQ